MAIGWSDIRGHIGDIGISGIGRAEGEHVPELAGGAEHAGIEHGDA